MERRFSLLLKVFAIAWIFVLINVLLRSDYTFTLNKRNKPREKRYWNVASSVDQYPFIQLKKYNNTLCPKNLMNDKNKKIDTGLGMALIDLFHKKSILNLEAPAGMLKHFLTDHRANMVWKSFNICSSDPSVLLDKTWRFDWTISFELESYNNIPSMLQNKLMDNLASLSRNGVLISWNSNKQSDKDSTLSANLNWNSNPSMHIIQQMSNRGFNYDSKVTDFLRKSVAKDQHLKQSLLAFRCCNINILDTEKLKNCTIKPPTLNDAMGGWQYTKWLIKSQHVKFDESLGKTLIKFLNNKEIVDIGAGVGQLEYLFINHNANIRWTAFDGGINIADFHGQNVALRDDPNHIVPKVCWLNAAVVLNKHWKYDWVISIEVGEHIPKKFEAIFIDNLVSLSREGIIVSWAIPGQNGYEHVNTQSNEYIIEQMKLRGMHYDTQQTALFRKSASIWYLKNTIMVFRK